MKRQIVIAKGNFVKTALAMRTTLTQRRSKDKVNYLVKPNGFKKLIKTTGTSGAIGDVDTVNVKSLT